LEFVLIRLPVPTSQDADRLNSWTVVLMLLAIVSPGGEFLHADNLADAVVFMMNNYDAKDWVSLVIAKVLKT